MEWESILSAPAYVINLDRRPERWAVTSTAIATAGYKNIIRWKGVDAINTDLKAAWAEHGSPAFDPSDQDFIKYPGKQGCMLSHLGILKHCIAEKVPYFTVFEDDIKFHERWHSIASRYFEHTPPDWDLLYMGAQVDFDSPHHIDHQPCFCTHAMIFTLKGAERIYNYLVKHHRGVRTIDCMLKDAETDMILAGGAMQPYFSWYNWNGRLFPTSEAIMEKGWTKRNSGLVFQDVIYGSDVCQW